MQPAISLKPAGNGCAPPEAAGDRAGLFSTAWTRWSPVRTAGDRRGFIGKCRISVSLATVEFKPAGSGTEMVFTEQAAFLDGYDDAGSRERGTNWLLDKLGESLKRA
ncbi:MAG TPA: hypothetical protein VF194_10995 [Ferrovibrio sp.]|uniref:hypothetical protein n=1 Tax=Ferrovibrio sp. TaxID=1917215 RepID=UPI002ECFC6B7